MTEWAGLLAQDAGVTHPGSGAPFSPDSRLLAVGSADKTVWLWNVSDPAHPAKVRPPLTGPTSYVWAVAFSPDGTTLAAGVTNGTVWMWNLADPAHPALIATLTGPQGHVFSVAFSPSGLTWPLPATTAPCICGTPARRRPRRTSAPAQARGSPARSGRPTSRACRTVRPAGRETRYPNGPGAPACMSSAWIEAKRSRRPWRQCSRGPVRAGFDGAQ